MMKRRNIFKTLLGSALALSMSVNAHAADMDADSKASFDVVMAFMGAVGSGDMEAAISLMADDMVWQNEGMVKRRFSNFCQFLVRTLKPPRGKMKMLSPLETLSRCLAR